MKLHVSKSIVGISQFKMIASQQLLLIFKGLPRVLQGQMLLIMEIKIVPSKQVTELGDKRVTTSQPLTQMRNDVIPGVFCFFDPPSFKLPLDGSQLQLISILRGQLLQAYLINLRALLRRQPIGEIVSNLLPIEVKCKMRINIFILF